MHKKSFTNSKTCTTIEITSNLNERKRMEEVEQAYNEYRKAYYRRESEVCTRLITLAGFEDNETFKKWLLDAVSFIREEKL